nr:MAG TPA: Terminase small subunit [Caudoviricetes sp.]
MPKGKEPTPKQKAFADEFLKCGNQTEAAKRAGYSEKTARQAGAENMKKPVVLEYIQKRQKQIDDARIADITEIMQYLTSVMRGEVKDQFDLDAPLSERTRCAQELLKRNMDDRRMDIELAKLEAQYKDSAPEEESTDNFLDALNATASEVWTDE